MGKQIKFWFLATLTTLMVLAGSILQLGEPLIAAQTMPTIEIANQLYLEYPDIPRVPLANTTLLSRFIYYHLETQARPAQYHLDWELSVADYLDVPYDNSKLNKSDVSLVDKQAMKALSLQQRHALVRSLEKQFTQWR